MIEVYQAEWCPFSHLLRERLTELGVDYVARQVEPNPPERDKLREVTGQDSIPAVVLDDGSVLAGETEDIIAALDERLPHWGYERAHVEQAIAHGVTTPAAG
jgi:glutaredoxin